MRWMSGERGEEDKWGAGEGREQACISATYDAQREMCGI